MSYQVIARKWRPQRFSDMVGQEHIARTLKNAVMSGRIAHAYLFVGPRGIGKTTTARIFAKALNCTNPVDGEPCCKCASCRSIADETNVDVIEIDAATHTQVEKARELCEDVLHLPISSKYKIYIIDEVHMLSKSAWNALLKTIEEPPAHAKFIFATTEVNKVLPTVISRCQRFDLRRIKSADIAARLRLISDSEHVNISDSAIRVIAQAADGGMRDAQSLLDQLISFFGFDANNQISEAQALSLFGLTATADMQNLMKAILTNDRISVVRTLHRFAEQSKNLETLFDEILAWLRGILLCRILPDPETVLEESAEKIAVYKNLAKDARQASTQRLLESLASSGYLLREAINKQVFLESILLKAMRIAHAPQIEDLIARLNQIRNDGELDALKSVVPLYEVPAGTLVATPESHFAPPAEPVTPAVAPAPVQTVSAPEPVQNPKPAPEVVLPPEQKTEPQVIQEAIPVPVPEPLPPVKEQMEEEPVAERPPEDATEVVPDVVSPDAEPVIERPPEDEVISGSDPGVVETAPEALGLPPGATPDEIWQKLCIDVRESLGKELLATFMLEGTPDFFRNGVLQVAFDFEYELMQSAMVEKDLPLLNRRFQELMEDSHVKIKLDRRSGLATPQQKQQKEDVEAMMRDMNSDPQVQEIMDLFGGRVVDVHAPASKEA